MSLKGTQQTDERTQSFIDKIAQWGYMVMSVSDTVESPTGMPSFSYSTGAFESYAAPEIVISGLSSNLMKSMIDSFMERWRVGEKLEPGVPLPDFLGGGFDVICVDVTGDRKAVSDYAIWADWYYERQTFPLWQMVWPGAQTGTFPWEDAEVADLQENVTGLPWPETYKIIRRTLS